MKRYIIGCLLVSIVAIAFYVRLINTTYDYSSLIGTDAVRYAYQAQQIIENGRLPHVDTSRAYPIGEHTSTKLTLYPYFIAGFYRIVRQAHVDFERFFVFLPVMLFGLTIVLLYLIVQRLLDQGTALLSLSILALIPVVSARTYAGFADRDGFVLLLAMGSFLFYICSYHGDIKKRWLYRGLSSIAMLCVGLTWQGVGIFVFILVTVELIRIMTDTSYDAGSVALFAFWEFILLSGLLLSKPNVYMHLLSQPYALVAIAYPVIVLAVALLVLVASHSSWLRNLLTIRNRVPVVFSVIPFLALMTYVWMPDNTLNALMASLTRPFGGDPLFEHIGELQKLGALGWARWPGVFFIPAVVGLLLIANEICDALALHKYWTLGWTQLGVFGVAFSRLTSGQSSTNIVENSLTVGIYVGSIGISVIALMLGVGHARLTHGGGSSPQRNTGVWHQVFLVVWFFGTLVLMRSAVRFTYLFAIPATISGSYALMHLVKSWIQRDKECWIYSIVIIGMTWQIYALLVHRQTMTPIALNFLYGLLVCLTLYFVLSMNRFLQKRTVWRHLGVAGIVVYTVMLTALSPHIALGGYASLIRHGLQAPRLAEDPGVRKALTWIRNNTPADSVIAADWEYGAWLNLITHRATVVDEEQRLNRVHLMDRKLFLGTDLSDALELLRTYEADFLFLTVRNIQILESIARENTTTHSLGLGIFGNVVQRVHFVHDADTDRHYYRYWLPNWQWYVGDHELRLEGKTYPPGTWYITSIYIECTDPQATPSAIKAMIELAVDGNPRYLAPEHFYWDDTPLSVEGIQPFLPCTLIIDSNKHTDPTRWHIAYLSPTARSAIITRLFLLNELGQVFERVYPPQGASSSDCAAQVWKIHYPDTIKRKKEYLQLDTVRASEFQWLTR